MSDTETRDRRETDRVCITCGKLGGACRWTDDAETCMRNQLQAARSGFELAENEAIRYAGFYPQASDSRNTFLLLANRIAEIADGKR